MAARSLFAKPESFDASSPKNAFRNRSPRLRQDSTLIKRTLKGDPRVALPLQELGASLLAGAAVIAGFLRLRLLTRDLQDLVQLLFRLRLAGVGSFSP